MRKSHCVIIDSLVFSLVCPLSKASHRCSEGCAATQRISCSLGRVVKSAYYFQGASVFDAFCFELLE